MDLETIKELSDEELIAEARKEGINDWSPEMTRLLMTHKYAFLSLCSEEAIKDEDLSYDLLKKLYIDQGYKGQEVADMLGVSYQKIVYNIRKYGLTRLRLKCKRKK